MPDFQWNELPPGKNGSGKVHYVKNLVRRWSASFYRDSIDACFNSLQIDFTDIIWGSKESELHNLLIV